MNADWMSDLADAGKDMGRIKKVNGHEKAKNKKGKKQKKKKPKKLRPHSALLRVMRAIDGINSIVLFITSHITIPFLNKFDEKIFSGRGPPHNPLEGVFMLLSCIPIKNYRSRNHLINKIKWNREILKILKLCEGEKAKNPFHGSVFTRYVERIGSKSHAKVMGYFVKMLFSLRVITGRIIIIDSKPIDLCPQCKHCKNCPYLKGKKYFPKDCLKEIYEWAEPFYKDKDKRCVGAKKHTIVDFDSGLSIAEIITPGNVFDSTVGIGLLKEIKKMSMHPEYVLADGAYNNRKVHWYIIEILESKAVTNYNKRNEKATTITFKNRDGKWITITAKGTPICAAGLRMAYKGYQGDEKANEWGCVSRCEEVGGCILGKRGCTKYTYTQDDYRRFSNPPYESKEYKELYALRKQGEQPYSQFDQNLSIPMEVKSLEGLKVHVYIADTVPLIMALIAHGIGIKDCIYERNMGSFIQYIAELIYGMPHNRFYNFGNVLYICCCGHQMLIFGAWFDIHDTHPPPVLTHLEGYGAGYIAG